MSLSRVPMFRIFLLMTTQVQVSNTINKTTESTNATTSSTFKCGQAPVLFQDENKERIINGTYSPARGAYPFMVNIKLGWQHWCGGALYDKITVISAAHCFWRGQDVSDLKLFFADFDQKIGRFSITLLSPMFQNIAVKQYENRQ